MIFGRKLRAEMAARIAAGIFAGPHNRDLYCTESVNPRWTLDSRQATQRRV